ncbi:hypothetical protein [Pseudomonas sp. NFXW11]|uniref:hypothetical protein n=1 Tax=Pseudomonas sp. NFXW11 TaxID=2819531 RepID=UPI003CF6BAA9
MSARLSPASAARSRARPANAIRSSLVSAQARRGSSSLCRSCTARLWWAISVGLRSSMGSGSSSIRNGSGICP